MSTMPSSEKLITESEKLKKKPLASTGMGRLTKRPKILIAEGDDSLRQSLKEVFVRHGFGVNDSPDQTSVLQIVPNPSIDLIIIGSFEKSAWAGLEVARQIRRLDTNVPIILIASKTSEELAVAALRIGINDYFRQPFPFEELVSSVTRRLSHLFPRSLQQDTKGPESEIIDGNRMIGESLALREIRAAVGTIASTDSNLLVTGRPARARSWWPS